MHHKVSNNASQIWIILLINDRLTCAPSINMEMESSDMFPFFNYLVPRISLLRMQRRVARNEFDELIVQGENLLKSCKANPWIRFHKCYSRSSALHNNLTKVVNKKTHSDWVFLKASLLKITEKHCFPSWTWRRLHFYKIQTLMVFKSVKDFLRLNF